MSDFQTRRYDGATDAARQAAYIADSTAAAAGGWVPVSRATQTDAAGQQVLVVEYAYRSAVATAGPSAPPPPPSGADNAPPPPQGAGWRPDGRQASAVDGGRPYGRPLAVAGVVAFLLGAVLAAWAGQGVAYRIFYAIMAVGLALLFAAGALAAWRRTSWGPERRYVLTGLALLFAAGSLGVAAKEPATAASASTAPAATAATLTGVKVTSPADGATVGDAHVTVHGATDPGARVVRDVSMGPDDSTTADNTGAWSIDLTLSPGTNLLTFREGDDRSTAVTVTITYAAAAAASPVATASPAPATSPSPVVTESPTPSPTQATPAPTPAPTPTPTPDTATLADPTGDMVDEEGTPASGPAYQDITKVYVEARQGRLQLDMWMAAAPPTRDPFKELISFNSYIDTNGDGSPEYQLLVANETNKSDMNAPGWNAGITRYTGDMQSQMGSDFPGTLVVDGNHITVRVMLFAMEFPKQISVAAATESDYWVDPVNDPTNDRLRHDFAPDSQWPNGHAWITVAAT